MTRIYVAGHRGMVGAAIVRALGPEAELVTRTHDQLELRDQAAVERFFAAERIEAVYLAAAKVGGIHANRTYPADFIYDNLMIQANVIQAAHRHSVARLLFLGSSCIYPRLAAQPMTEDALLGGPLEPTNEPYAIAKIAGIKLCESYARQYGCDFRSVMPTNLYGIGDNYDLDNSHVVPALIRRFLEAKAQDAPTIAIWGTGSARREFLYVDDMAAACVHVMNLSPEAYRAVTQPMLGHLNVGSGIEITIAELAATVARAVGYRGTIVYDPTKPDGTPRKLLDSSKLLALGWQPQVTLEAGLQLAIADALARGVVTR